MGRRSSISSAARGLPMALRPARRPSTGYPAPAAPTRLRRSAWRASSLPGSLSSRLAAHALRAGVPRLRGRLAGLSPAAEPGSSSPSVHSTPLLVAGPPPPPSPLAPAPCPGGSPKCPPAPALACCSLGAFSRLQTLPYTLPVPPRPPPRPRPQAQVGPAPRGREVGPESRSLTQPPLGVMWEGVWDG